MPRFVDGGMLSCEEDGDCPAGWRCVIDAAAEIPYGTCAPLGPPDAGVHDAALLDAEGTRSDASDPNTAIITAPDGSLDGSRGTVHMTTQDASVDGSRGSGHMTTLDGSMDGSGPAEDASTPSTPVEDASAPSNPLCLCSTEPRLETGARCDGLDPDACRRGTVNDDGVCEDVPGCGTLDGVAQVVGGHLRTCALRDDDVYCWGNWPGTAYDGFPTGHAPMSMGLGPAVEIGLNGRHVCARTASGAIRCQTQPNGPIEEPVIGDAVSLAMIQRVGCAARTAGSVECWGSHPQFLPSEPSVPTAMAGFAGAVQVSLSAYHLCALNSAGEVHCTADGSAPVQVALPEAASKLDGYGETCALLQSGGVACWQRELTAVSITGLGGLAEPAAIDLAVGSGFACSATDAGLAKCWGRSNYSGTLGDGTNDPRPGQEHDAQPVVGLVDSRAVGAGSQHACAVEGPNRELQCWGTLQSGVLGTAEAIRPGPSDLDFAVPEGPLSGCHGGMMINAEGRLHHFGWPFVGADIELDSFDAPLDFVSAYSATTASRPGSCGLTADGSAYCWGAATYDAQETATPLRMPLDDVLAVASGDQFGCASTAAGIHCWQFYGDRPPELLGGPGDLVELAAPAAHACGRRSNGDVYCVGYSQSGRASGDFGTPSLRTDLPPMSSLAAGQSRFCGISVDGELYCWTATSVHSTCMHLPEPAVQVAVNVFGSVCARVESGRIFCFGDNRYGYLGDGTSVDRPCSMAVPGLDDATDLAAGNHFFCARRPDGRLSCWGALRSRWFAPTPSAVVAPEAA